MYKYFWDAGKKCFEEEGIFYYIDEEDWLSYRGRDGIYIINKIGLRHLKSIVKKRVIEISPILQEQRGGGA